MAIEGDRTPEAGDRKSQLAVGEKNPELHRSPYGDRTPPACRVDSCSLPTSAFHF